MGGSSKIETVAMPCGGWQQHYTEKGDNRC